ncbi:MAG: MBL fold metallo-hydrolase [Vallitaleaceae bacterium]|jgi:competence protein ComEC|nr:MBL fold metallo-hydrolase [Vallitaleaceae bacterium]
MKNKQKLFIGILLILVASLFIILILKKTGYTFIDHAMTESSETEPVETVTLSNGQLMGIIQTTESGSIEKDEIRVHFIAVGQGDSMLIESGTGEYVLIDTGPVEAEDILGDYLQNLGVRHFQYVVGTHPHDDHIGNLGMILENYEVDELWIPDIERDQPAYYGAVLAAKNNEVPIVHPLAGTSFEFAGGVIEVLAPNSSSYDELNDYSIVIRYTYGDRHFLFSGDAEEISEDQILEAEADIHAVVLKVGHHGSASSSSIDYIDAIRPEIAVITCGLYNDNGHPHDEILKLFLYGEYHVEGLYRTDLDGDVVITTDGETLEVSVGSDNQQMRADHLGIEIEAIDKYEEYVIIYNSLDTPVDISNWEMYSEKGHQSIRIPEGVVLDSDDRYSIGGYGAANDMDLIGEEENGGIWSNSKQDDGILYDASGNLIDVYVDSSIDE